MVRPLAVQLLLAAVLSLVAPIYGYVPSYFTELTANLPVASFTVRSNAFTFEWAGLIWVVGGINAASGSSYTQLGDVWKSGDFGRTWTQVTPVGLDPCTTGTTSADVNAGRVTLVCAGFPNSGRTHGTSYSFSGLTQGTYFSTDPNLVSWTAVTPATTGPGPVGLFSFTVDRMAVPFTGVGSLVSLGGGSDATVGLPATAMGSNAVFTSTDSGANWVTTTIAPWSKRYGHSTTTDADQLTLILTGGITTGTTANTLNNDVWQLTWTLAGAQQWYQLQAMAPFPLRKFAAMYHVHDWLFLYGGSTDTGRATDSNPLDDVWASADYGTTWSQMSTNGTGIARHGVTPLTISRRLFVVGGSACSTINYPTLNDVWVAYW